MRKVPARATRWWPTLPHVQFLGEGGLAIAPSYPTRQKSRTTLDNQKKSVDYVSPQNETLSGYVSMSTTSIYVQAEKKRMMDAAASYYAQR